MHTVAAFKILVYPQNIENPLIEKYQKIISSQISYRNEDELGEIIKKLQIDNYLSKEVLILKEFKGRFYQKCPGSPGMICCNYHLLNTCFDCLYDCTYCYLLSYLNAYGITQFLNLDVLYDEMSKFIENADSQWVYRIGTGEYTDSLMMDEYTDIGVNLIKLAAQHPNIMLEFKTKSKNVDHLLKIKEKGSTVIAWTLNTPENIARYEKNTANLDERLEAAQKSVAAGYYVAFHFDPIIYHDNLSEYLEIVDRIFTMMDPQKVVWISMGGFRYAPSFKEIISKYDPSEQLTTAEMFPGLDGKFRYLKPERVKIYRAMKEKIETYSDYPFVYMCMENSAVWKDVFDRDYEVSEDLEEDFINHLKAKFIGEI